MSESTPSSMFHYLVVQLATYVENCCFELRTSKGGVWCHDVSHITDNTVIKF